MSDKTTRTLIIDIREICKLNYPVDLGLLTTVAIKTNSEYILNDQKWQEHFSFRIAERTLNAGKQHKLSNMKEN